MPFSITNTGIRSATGGSGIQVGISGSTFSISFDTRFSPSSSTDLSLSSTIDDTFQPTTLVIPFTPTTAASKFIVLAFGVLGEDDVNNNPPFSTIEKTDFTTTTDLSSGGLGLSKEADDQDSLASSSVGMGEVNQPEYTSGHCQYEVAIRTSNIALATSAYWNPSNIDSRMIIIPLPVFG